MDFPVALKVIPKAVGHLSVNKLYGPLREFEKREEVDRYASKAGLDEDEPPPMGKQFTPPPSNPFQDLVNQGLDILPTKLLIV